MNTIERIKVIQARLGLEAGDLDGIADQNLTMKHLWQDRGLDGLLRRREFEADLVRDSEHDYDAAELVRI